MSLLLATRNSPLALWQAHRTRTALLETSTTESVGLVEVQSSGDLDRTSDLARFGRIGIFTVEVDRAVLDERAHVGVHSMKDLTTTLSDGMVLAGALPRGPVEDVLVSRSGTPLAELASGASIGTGSIRRAAMVRRERPDLDVRSIRGNVATRLRKLDEGEFDAIVLARAGLVRLGLDDRIDEVISIDRFLPAVGQGIVGLTCRANDTRTAKAIEEISCPSAWAAALAERALLRGLHGGCNAPIGAHARLVDEQLSLEARVLSADGSEQLTGSIDGPAANAASLGSELAEQLLERGAARLVEESAS